MVDNIERDGDRLSRRRLLALAGTGLLGSAAGCGGSSRGSPTGTPTDTESPTERPTDSPTPTPTPTPTETPTPSPTPTASPTPTPDPNVRHIHRGGNYDIVVSADGDGDFESVQAAIDAIPEYGATETRVFIEEGRYKEKLTLPESKRNVTFIGASAGNTVLTYDDHADKLNENNEPIGTSGSSSFFLNGHDFSAKNITFENAAEPVAQAVAMRVRGDRAVFVNCRFLGNQDTLYTYGKDSRQYYENCYIEGDVDFIFGWSKAVFEDCEIRCKPDGGYVTAAATPEQNLYGYVFKNCEVTAAGDTPDDSYYLGRPWRPYANVVFMHTYMEDHIKPEGWDDWGEEFKQNTAYYAEYECEGPGYTPEERVFWSYQPDELDLDYSLPAVFDGWNPPEVIAEE